MRRRLVILIGLIVLIGVPFILALIVVGPGGWLVSVLTLFLILAAVVVIARFVPGTGFTLRGGRVTPPAGKKRHRTAYGQSWRFPAWVWGHRTPLQVPLIKR